MTLKYNFRWWYLLTTAMLVLSACEKQPRVFSLNNFATAFANRASIPGVRQLGIKNLHGKWIGMDHELIIDSLPEWQDTGFKIRFIDLIKDDKIIDTTVFYIDFLKVNSHTFIEVINMGTKPADHDFNLPISTYYLLKKMSADTIIAQRMNNVETRTFLEKSSYKYFIPEDETVENPKIYLAEPLHKMASFLKEISKHPGVFTESDTLVRSLR